MEDYKYCVFKYIHYLDYDMGSTSDAIVINSCNNYDECLQIINNTRKLDLENYANGNDGPSGDMANDSFEVSYHIRINDNNEIQDIISDDY